MSKFLDELTKSLEEGNFNSESAKNINNIVEVADIKSKIINSLIKRDEESKKLALSDEDFFAKHGKTREEFLADYNANKGDEVYIDSFEKLKNDQESLRKLSSVFEKDDEIQELAFRIDRDANDIKVSEDLLEKAKEELETSKKDIIKLIGSLSTETEETDILIQNKIKEIGDKYKKSL